MKVTCERAVKPGGMVAATTEADSLGAAARKVQLAAKFLRHVELPGTGELHYCNNFPDFRQPLAQSIEDIQAMLRSCEEAIRPHKGSGIGPEIWADSDNFQAWVTDLLDDALEGVDTALDQHKAAAKRASALAAAAGWYAEAPALLCMADPSSGAHQVWTPPAGQLCGLSDNAAVGRPQDRFSPPVDNSNVPFRPCLDHLTGLTASPLPLHGLAGGAAQVHPFRQELETLRYKPWQVDVLESQLPGSLEDTPLRWVDTPEALSKMVLELQTAKHVALDLEAHSFRSFLGFTCLLQLSSRSVDYVVDGMALRSQLGPALAALLGNPAVVKVLHGADRDVEWLQRDYGLYLVNLFDTGQAARVLALPSAGLEYLLSSLCSVKADKQYQLADWRVRPLTPAMLNYARSDTHYLLYCYDRLKHMLSELADSQVLDRYANDLPVTMPVDSSGVPVSRAMACVLERSRRLCCKLYEKELLTPDSAADQARRWGLLIDDKSADHASSRHTSGSRASMPLAPESLSVFKALYEWRDRVCRAADESVGYVLPRKQITQLAHDMPGSVAALRKVLGSAMSGHVCRDAAEVVAAIQQGKQRHQEQLAAAGAASAAATGSAAGDVPARQGSAMELTNGAEGGADAVGAAAAVAATASAGAVPGAAAATLAAPLAARAVAPITSARRPAAKLRGMPATAPSEAVDSALASRTHPEVAIPSPVAEGRTLEASGSGDGVAGTCDASPNPAAPDAGANTALAVDDATAAAATVAAAPSAVAPVQVCRPAGRAGAFSAVLGMKRRGVGACPTNGAAGGAGPGGLPAGAQHAREAAERASKLHTSFVLPFVSAPTAAPEAEPPLWAVGSTAKSAAAAAAAVATAALDGADGVAALLHDGAVKAQTTAADIRGVVDQMRQDDAKMAAEPDAAAMEDAEGDEWDEGQRPSGDILIRGSDINFDTQEFVPVPLSLAYVKNKRARSSSSGKGKRAAMHSSPGEQSEGGGEGVSSDSESSDSEGGGIRNGASVLVGQKRRRAAAGVRGKAQPKMGGEASTAECEGNGDCGPSLQPAFVPFDFQAAREAKGGQKGFGRGRGQGDRQRRGGRGGRRGGRDDRGRGERGGGRSGQAGGVHNPYALPDEHLLKGGKRSSTMPRSGNRSYTFT